VIVIVVMLYLLGIVMATAFILLSGDINDYPELVFFVLIWPVWALPILDTIIQDRRSRAAESQRREREGR
jgi:hypothetical protein